MGFGAQVWNETGKKWVDVVKPTWIIDSRYSVTGSGRLSYSIDTNKFKLKILLIHYSVGGGGKTPVFNISGANVEYSISVGTCSFLVQMENVK